jgi:exosortase
LFGLQSLQDPNGPGDVLPIVDRNSQLFPRHIGFGLFLAGSVVVFWTPLKNLINFSLAHEIGSHIFLVIPVSTYLIYLKQRQIFFNVRSGAIPATLLFATGTVLWLLSQKYANASQEDELSLRILALVMLWTSGFILFYGKRAFMQARFPLVFLLLLVPIPAPAIERITAFLQTGSADLSYGLFRLLTVPVFKQGFEIRLPSLNIEVAKECSGIRSSLILFITTLLIGQFALRSAWKKLLLILCVVPILIFKNAARIVALCLLSIYVDRGFLHGWLHTSGGILFYVLGLLTLIPIVMGLRKSERGKGADCTLRPLPPLP